MANCNNYSTLNKHDSMLNDYTMNSDSELNEAILMTSTDSFAEISVKPSDNSILAKTYDTCTMRSLANSTESSSHMVSHYEEKEQVDMDGTLEDFVTNALEHSNIWPALTVLEHSLCSSADDTNKENHEIIEKLYERYNNSPSDFTEHLITILEGSFLEFNEETNDSIDPDIPMSSSSFIKYNRPVEEESVPQSFFLLPNESTECTDSSVESSMPVDSLNIENNASINDSALYSSYDRVGKFQKRTITFSAVPKILVNDKECVISKIEPVQLFIKKTSNTRRSKGFRKTPKIFVQASSPNVKKTWNVNRESPRTSNEDDDYTTNDSENNEETMMIEESGTSINESVNMSKIAFFHEEWVNAYERLARYKPVNNTDTSLMLDRQRKITNHTNKLERRWLQELSKKRQKCFDVVDKLLQNVGNDSIESKTDTNLSCWYQNMKFYNTLMAVSDYFTYAMTSRESLESESRIKRNRRSSPKSSTNMAKKNVTSLLATRNPTKRISDKSLATKVIPLKSPGANKRRSLRRSITKSRTAVSPEPYAMTFRESLESEARAMRNRHSTPKSPTNVAKKNVSSLMEKISGKSLATKVTPLKSPRAKKRKSLRRSITKRRTGTTPKIDRTSIQPVHVLRMLYSPKARIPDKVYATESKIPLPKQGIWKSYLTDPSRKPATTNAAAETVGVQGFRSTTKFKHVKSPIREYIRGRK